MDLEPHTMMEPGIYTFSAPTSFSDAIGMPSADPLTGSPPDLGDGIFFLPSPTYPIIESAKQIFSVIAREKRLFLRGGAIAEVEATSDGHQIRPLSPEAFQSRIEGYDRKLMAWGIDAGKPVLRECRCSMAAAKALMASEAARLLPPIATVTRCSVLDLKGSVLGPGYHSHAGGIFVTSKHVPEDVPLAVAVTELWSILEDFDFLTQGDRARGMAALISPALRMGRLIEGRGFAPVDVAEADQSQSGKGYRHDLVLAVYGERRYQTAERKGGVGSLDESLSTALFSGRAFILMDNMRGAVTSTFLESFMTTDGRISVRVPRMTEVEVDGRGVTVQLSSNGFEATMDFVNRASFVRIRKRPEGYRFRQYPQGLVLDAVKARQPFYLGCVFAVVRVWIRRDRLRTNEQRHNFREWVGSLDYIVGEIMGAGIGTLMNGHQAAAERTANPSRTWLRLVGRAVLQSSQAEKDWLAGELGFLADEMGIPVPGGRPGADTDAKAAGRILARAFENANEVNIDDMTATRITKNEYDEVSRKVRDRHYYRFAAHAARG